MPLNNKNIVIVEDDPILCDLLKIRLSKLGYSVTGMYASGEDAIRAITGHPPDLIIMDVTLIGQMDGIDTALKIQEERLIPVVYLTGSSDLQTFERAKTTENSEYVIKPFSDNDLRIAIEMAYHKSEYHRKIKNKQHLLENVIGCLGSGLIVTDPAGTIILANPAAESLTGLHIVESKKTHFHEMVNIADENGNPIEIIPGTGSAELPVRVLPGNAVLVDPAGKKTRVYGTVSPLTDRNNKFEGIIVTLNPLQG